MLKDIFNLFRKKDSTSTSTSSPKGYDSYYYSSLSNDNKFSVAEPKTIASFALDNAVSIKNSKIQSIYSKHKTKLSNQWINPIQGINSGLGSANLSFFNYQVVNYTECGYLAQDPLMNNIFDILSTTPFSKEGTVKILDDNFNVVNDPELLNAINLVVLRKFKIFEILERAVKESFIYGGCLLYLDYGETDYLETPLEFEKIDLKKFRGFKLIEPILCAAIDVNTYNPVAKDYMEPNLWYISGLGAVHKSRFIKFEWNTPPLNLKPMCMYFGMPLTQLLKQDVANVNVVSQGLANLINKIRRTYIKMDKQSFASGNINSILNRLRLMQEVENNFTIFPIDYSEDIIQLTTSLNGITETIETFFDVISSKTGIPRNKLKGTSTGGLNASTSQIESDKNFMDKIETIRKSLIKERLTYMLEIATATLDGKFHKIDYDFQPIYVPTERETTETIERNTDIALKLKELGVKPQDYINWLINNKTNNMTNLTIDNNTENLEEHHEDDN